MAVGMTGDNISVAQNIHLLSDGLQLSAPWITNRSRTSRLCVFWQLLKALRKPVNVLQRELYNVEDFEKIRKGIALAGY